MVCKFEKANSTGRVRKVHLSLKINSGFFLVNLTYLGGVVGLGQVLLCTSMGVRIPAVVGGFLTRKSPRLSSAK